MKIGFLSDIHGNLEALTAALRSLERHRTDRIVCLGDVVGYGANPGECLDLVRRQAAIQVLGNHDAAAVGMQNLVYFNDFARAAAA
ncbi:MAG: metallophosphoesterase, partial [Candidatus Zixiibacteriota bacterium]